MVLIAKTWCATKEHLKYPGKSSINTDLTELINEIFRENVIFSQREIKFEKKQ